MNTIMAERVMAERETGMVGIEITEIENIAIRKMAEKEIIEIGYTGSCITDKKGTKIGFMTIKSLTLSIVFVTLKVLVKRVFFHFVYFIFYLKDEI
jgi:S-adenosylmethionine synthetase